MRVKSFYEIDSFSFIDQLTDRLRKEIEGKGKEYILGVDENEFKKYLTNEFTLEPLTIDTSTEAVEKPTTTKESRDDRFYGRTYEVEAYNFTVKYHFTGSGVLFRIRPSQWAMTTHEIYVDERQNIVSFSFKLYRQDAEEFKREKNQAYGSAFANLNNANVEATNWNNRLEGLINSTFTNIKAKYQKENDFFAAISIKVNPNTSSIFTAPTIQKKVIPQPTVKNKEFSSEPMMSQEMYNDLLKVVYESGKSMEKKPALYQDKDEEGLRDQFLFVLETRYEETTATGETFNRGGKTDIILKYSKDGSNLFVAECKFWHGASEFLKAISQLFDRYLTWRDSKAALLIFVKNKDFSNVLTTVKDEVKKHPYYKRDKGVRGETSFSYLFRLPQDENKDVYFEIMVFHYDK
jgi:hypothetical protein